MRKEVINRLLKKDTPYLMVLMCAAKHLLDETLAITINCMMNSKYCSVIIHHAYQCNSQCSYLWHVLQLMKIIIRVQACKGNCTHFFNSSASQLFLLSLIVILIQFNSL